MADMTAFLEKTNDKIKELQIKELELIEKLVELDEKIEPIEMNIAINVATETDQTNKLKFSNDTTRKAEISRRLGENIAYKNLIRERKSLDRAIKIQKIDIGYHERHYEIMMTVAGD